MSAKPYVCATVATLLLGAPLSGQTQPVGPPPPSKGSINSAVDTPNWRQIFENGISVDYIDNSNDGGHAVMADHPDAIYRNWLLDFKLPQVTDLHQISSIVSLVGIDCGKKAIVSISGTYYELNMGKGEIINSVDAGDTWHAPQPGSFETLLWNAACGKK